MIIRQTDSAFIMVRQHDHARLAGEIAGHMDAGMFLDDRYRADVLYAIAEHDRSWIRLDDTPIWNDGAGEPYSFSDYPLLPKLVLYRLGIDEVEERNEYAALLCSLFYASFPVFHPPVNSECRLFLEAETARQTRLRQRFPRAGDRIVDRHFRLLQLCDDLSLYVCLNEPGAPKEREHPWYARGFKRSAGLVGTDETMLQARWLDKGTIAARPFPFVHSFQAELQWKEVFKARVRQVGLNEAYGEAPWTTQRFRFAGGREDA